MRELDFQVQLLALKGRRVGDLLKRLDTKKKEQELVNKDLEAKKSVLKKQSLDKGTVEIELKAARAAVGREERVIRDFFDHVCTGYTILMRVRASGYCDGLNVVMCDAQGRGVYFGRFCMRVRKDKNSLYLGDQDSDEEHGVRTSPPKGSDSLDDVVVKAPWTSPS